MSGVSILRVLPTICVHMCRVSQVLSHSAKGSGGQPGSPARAGLARAGVVRSGEVKLHLVYVAPAPILAGLERLHDGVLGGMEMLGGVLVLRGIATAHMAAG